jgi:hypothetical protein
MAVRLLRWLLGRYVKRERCYCGHLVKRARDCGLGQCMKYSL